ncbi:MAG TPA: hypothetical protein VMV47_11215 [Bacteroidales bacterium]|nr:hypothetical protein [Bacteroidales bacterium]
MKKLSEVFKMNNGKLITEAIELLRDEQPFEGAIGLLVSLYDRTTEDEILHSIEGFMNDIRDQSAVPEIIAEIRNKWKPETTRMLASSCWQSGLDYSSYTTELTNVFMISDYATAIECLTVIGESAATHSPEKRHKLINLIDNKIELLNTEMKNLALELKSILS